MSGLRWRLIFGLGVISLVLAYLLRDVIYSVVIIPSAYILWLARLYYSAVPQWILWTVLLVVLFLAVLWSLLPEGRASTRQEVRRAAPEGQVEALMAWLEKSRHGNYFKWQLANRLGRIARALGDTPETTASLHSGDTAIDQYLDAGLNYSFVDFPSAASPFERAPRTPLDLDPSKVADYLESRMESTSGRHG